MITVGELLGRESATAVRISGPTAEVSAERRRGGPWVNTATVATAVVTFGSVLAVGSTFLPRSHTVEEPDTEPSTDVPITEALSAPPPSAAPVAKPAATKPLAVKPPAPVAKPAGGPAAPAPARLPGSTTQSRPLGRPDPETRPSGPVRHAAPTARSPRATAPATTGGSAKSGKPANSGKSAKSGAHRSSAQRPATAASRSFDPAAPSVPAPSVAAPNAAAANAAQPRRRLAGSPACSPG